uniref:Phosphatidylinositol transfer protein N-terminal domain-containing protein n=1 Tax=Chelonoidis abingdonii TaxID=106734 RepID=A0A8C0GSJ4_CHEAB
MRFLAKSGLLLLPTSLTFQQEQHGGGEGIEVLANERPGETGQNTHKLYHLHSKVPDFVKMLAPKGSLLITGVAGLGGSGLCYRPSLPPGPQNQYVRDNFIIRIEMWHKPDLGTQDNVNEPRPLAAPPPSMPHGQSRRRPPISPAPGAPQGHARARPRQPHPLPPSWELASNKESPHMCAYKLVTVNFHWWGLQGCMEQFIHKQRLFTNFNRQLFCWLDKWVDLSMDDIRRMEETQKELDEMRQKGAVWGLTAGDK